MGLLISRSIAPSQDPRPFIAGKTPFARRHPRGRDGERSGKRPPTALKGSFLLRKYSVPRFLWIAWLIPPWSNRMCPRAYFACPRQLSRKTSASTGAGRASPYQSGGGLPCQPPGAHIPSLFEKLSISDKGTSFRKDWLD